MFSGMVRGWGCGRTNLPRPEVWSARAFIVTSPYRSSLNPGTNLVMGSSRLRTSLLSSSVRAVMNLVALAMRIWVSNNDWFTWRPGAECSYWKTVVLPIETCTAKEVFCRKVKFWNTALGMLKLEVPGATDGGGRMGPGGEHRASVLAMKSGAAVTR